MHRLIAWFLLLLLCANCENAKFKPVTNNQNNQTGNLTLQFEVPASGEIALMAGQRSRVDIRVHDALGQPVSGARLDFRMVGIAGGTTLASSSALSDFSGLASLQLIAGASASHFQVRIENQKAVPLLLDVTVSSSGLVRFRVAFAYDGATAPGEIEGLQTGIVFGSACDALSPYTAEMDRKRTLPSWFTLVEYPELPIDLPFSIVARGMAGADQPRIHGCITPETRFLVPDATVDVEIRLEDYTRQLAGPWSFQATIDAETLPARARELFGSWRNPGRCPLGLSQLYLDCLGSLLESGDLSTCGPGVPTPESAQLADHRGRIDAQGCRSSLDGSDQQSLESLLQASLDWSTYQDHLELLESILASEELATARLQSRLLPVDAALQLEVTSVHWWHEGLWHPIPVSAPSLHDFSCPATVETCEPEPFLMTLDWQNLLIRHLRETCFDPASIPLEGSEFAAILLESAQAVSWPGSLSDRFSAELGITLPLATWTRAFELMGLQLNNPSMTDTGPDCQVTGSLLIPDRDLDFLVDTVIPALTFSPCTPPCSP